MVTSENKDVATVCVFGFLRRYLDEKGLPYTFEKPLPPEGRPASDIAREVYIPLKEIEAVFRNGRVVNIYDQIFPGDRVSFFPFGTPGPYRVFLGIARENEERARREGGEGKDGS